MKITIDTSHKLITISQPTKLVDIINFMKETIKDWESYSIESEYKNDLTPFYLNDRPVYDSPYPQPYTITCTNGNPLNINL